MSRKIQFHAFHLLFRLFSYLSDKSGGWSMFVRPKLMIGGVILTLGLALPEKAIAQKQFEDDETPPKQTVFPDSARIKAEEELEPFCYIVEQMPEFTGGNEAMFQFLTKNIVYPKEAIDKKLEGMVICTFIVVKDGSISDIKIVRGIDQQLDSVAVRIIKAMPKWLPGKQGGNAVSMKFTLPIRFTLPNASKQVNSIRLKDSLNAQSETVGYNRTDSTFQNNDDIPEPISVVESVPEFPKGTDAMFKHIAEHIIYPKEPEESSIQGIVLCTFLVDKDGTISEIKVLRSIHPLLDQEAVRIIKTFPKWTPAMQGGKPVPFIYTLPIKFTLPKKTK